MCIFIFSSFAVLIFLQIVGGMKFWAYVQELKQYPTLRVEVGNAAFESLERMRDESKKATLKLVDMESSYLTVDFFRKLPQEIEKGGNPTHSIFDRYNDSYLRRIGKWYSKWKVFMSKLLWS